MRQASVIEHLMPNPMLALSARCQQRRVMGQSVVDLSVGQPDFPTPVHVAEAGRQAITDGETRYPPLRGIGPLRVAIGKRLAAEGTRVSPRQTMVTSGAAGALQCAFQALLEPEDRVLVPAPYYPAYLSQIRLAGGIPTPIPTGPEEGYRLTVDGLRRAAMRGARLLVLNNPSNPTGVVYTRAELEALAEQVVELGLDVIADEVYCDFIHDGPPFVSFAALGSEIRARTLVVRSLSKSYAMTGWRIGYAAGPAPVIKAMVEVQHASVIAPTSISQWAAAAALNGDPSSLDNMQRTFAARHRYLRDRLDTMPGVRCAPSRGGLFVFADLSARCGDVDSFCRRLLDHHGVAVVPGGVFGAPRCARLSLAVPQAELEDGLDRLELALQEAEEVTDHENAA